MSSRVRVFALLGCLSGLCLACNKSEPKAPVVAPPAPAAPTPPPPPQPVDAATVPGAPPAVDVVEEQPETPLTACQRACSATGNRLQMEGFVKCEGQGGEADGKKLAACKAKVLATTDKSRATCRRACAGKADR